MEKEKPKEKEAEKKEEEKKDKAIGDAYDQFISLEKERQTMEAEPAKEPSYPSAYIEIGVEEDKEFKIGDEKEITFICEIRAKTIREREKGKKVLELDLKLKKVKF